MELESGHKVIPLSDEENAEQLRLFKGYTEGLIQLDPGRWFLSSGFAKWAPNYYNLKLRPTDIIILTFPKSGTTWTQEIVWTMISNREFNNPLANLPITARVPFLEADFLFDTKNIPPPSSMTEMMEAFEMLCPDKDVEDGLFWQMAEATPDPRIIKTHLPFSLLPKNMLDTCKIICVARDPKDVCISFHHHSRMFKGHDYQGTLDEFVDLFVEDKVLYGPYWELMKEALDREGHPNMHMCYYEDMKKDPKAEFKRIDNFLKADLTEEQLDKIVEYTSFKVMKVRENHLMGASSEEALINTEIVKKEGGFFRKGETGDGKAKLSPEQSEKIDKWTSKNAKSIGKKIKYCTEYNV